MRSASLLMIIEVERGGRAVCVHCGTAIVQDTEHPTTWLDSTDGDCCEGTDDGTNANGAHESKQDLVTCGTCGRTWNDAIGTSLTPAPSGRCPFEYDHEEEGPPDAFADLIDDAVRTLNDLVIHIAANDHDVLTPMMREAIRDADSFFYGLQDGLRERS